MGYGHLVSASELNLGQAWAHGGASRGLVVPIPPFGLKEGGGGIHPFHHLPKMVDSKCYYAAACIKNMGWQVHVNEKQQQQQTAAPTATV